jgi:hypothetical protein
MKWCFIEPNGMQNFSILLESRNTFDSVANINNESVGEV